MSINSALFTALVFSLAHSCIAQEQSKSTPIELEVLKASVGVWDAEVEVWSQGPDSPSTKFNGVETNRLFGEYWIASDSEYVGMKLHSIVGYDLDQKKLVGTVIDHGPYAASMTGDYDMESKTIHWMTKAKDTTGKPLVQKTSITQKNADERVLVLWVPGKEENEFTKFMQIRFVKRKETPTQETEAATSDSKTISLFNGKDLTGWHIDVPHLDENPDADATFVVRDGKLVSLGQPNGHLITDSKYENYRLEVEYRFAGKPGNCGVLVHASTPRALYKMFPKSIEVQMNHGHAGDFWCIVEDITVPDMEKRRGPKETWGITEGKARRIHNLTDDSEEPAGEWNTMVIECVKDAVKVWVNGVLVNHGTGCTATKGQIALQAEGSEVEFRKLSLTPIAKLTE